MENLNVQTKGRLPIISNEYGLPITIRFKGIEKDLPWEEEKEIRRKNNILWTKENYEKMGIKIIDNDDLFYNVELPEGWVIKPTTHCMWHEVFDDKNRIRMDCFHKFTFYENEAFVNFKVRFQSCCNVNDYDESLFTEKPKFIEQGTKQIWVDENNNPVENIHEKNGRCIVESFGDGEWITADYYDNDDFTLISSYRNITVPNYVPNPDYKPMTGYEKYSQPFHYEVQDYDGTILFKSDIVKTDFEYSKDIHVEFFRHRRELEEKTKEQCRNWIEQNYPDYEDIHKYWDLKINI